MFNTNGHSKAAINNVSWSHLSETSVLNKLASQKAFFAVFFCLCFIHRQIYLLQKFFIVTNKNLEKNFFVPFVLSAMNATKHALPPFSLSQCQWKDSNPKSWDFKLRVIPKCSH
jgi:hypothetical protein